MVLKNISDVVKVFLALDRVLVHTPALVQY